MDIDKNNMDKHRLLYEELTYRIIGCAYKVRNLFGSGHKESLYQEAFGQELAKENLSYKAEPQLAVVHPETGKALKSRYRPDFLVEDKVIVETKAVPKSPKFLSDQLYDYLRNSQYEIGLLINFAQPSLKPLRIIYTNDRKHRLAQTKNTDNSKLEK